MDICSDQGTPWQAARSRAKSLLQGLEKFEENLEAKNLARSPTKMLRTPPPPPPMTIPKTSLANGLIEIPGFEVPVQITTVAAMWGRDSQPAVDNREGLNAWLKELEQVEGANRGGLEANNMTRRGDAADFSARAGRFSRGGGQVLSKSSSGPVVDTRWKDTGEYPAEGSGKDGEGQRKRSRGGVSSSRSDAGPKAGAGVLEKKRESSRDAGASAKGKLKEVVKDEKDAASKTLDIGAKFLGGLGALTGSALKKITDAAGASAKGVAESTSKSIKEAADSASKSTRGLQEVARKRAQEAATEMEKQRAAAEEMLKKEGPKVIGGGTVKEAADEGVKKDGGARGVERQKEEEREEERDEEEVEVEEKKVMEKMGEEEDREMMRAIEARMKSDYEKQQAEKEKDKTKGEDDFGIAGRTAKVIGVENSGWGAGNADGDLVFFEYSTAGSKGMQVKINQDTTLAEKSEVIPGLSIFGMFDGHGGSGEVVSQYVAQRLPQVVEEYCADAIMAGDFQTWNPTP